MAAIVHEKKSYCMTALSKKAATGIMILIMLAVLMFSAFFIAAESAHECSGEDCPVCRLIQQCGHAMREAGLGALIIPASAVIFVFLVLYAAVIAFDFIKDTPISMKIRLND